MTIRKSQSNISPKLVEYLQGKLLIRFNINTEIKEQQTLFNYIECVFEINQTVQEIEAICLENGFVLTEDYADHKALIV